MSLDTFLVLVPFLHAFDNGYQLLHVRSCCGHCGYKLLFHHPVVVSVRRQENIHRKSARTGQANGGWETQLSRGYWGWLSEQRQSKGRFPQQLVRSLPDSYLGTLLLLFQVISLLSGLPCSIPMTSKSLILSDLQLSATAAPL